MSNEMLDTPQADQGSRAMPDFVKRGLIRVQGGLLYLKAPYRVLWMREEHPDWSIVTSIEFADYEKGFAVVRAVIMDGEGRILATAHSEESRGKLPYLRKAECVPLSTRILTVEGWKFHNELCLGETVAAYNLETELLEWVPLLAVRTYGDAPVVRVANKRGFEVVCTRDHKWPVRYQWPVKYPNHSKYSRPVLKETCSFNTADCLIIAAKAPGGQLPVTQQQAFIMGMLITDGSVRYHGKHIRAYICQSKPVGVEAIRRNTAGIDACQEEAIKAHTRTFPTGRTYDCLAEHRWHFGSTFMHNLFAAFGIENETELPGVVSRLSEEARSSMLEAMMLAEGDAKGNFAQMPGRNDFVIDVWTILCALEGYAVSKSTRRETPGNIGIARRKRRQHVTGSYLSITDAGAMPVWCPQTPLGTWVARFDNDVTCITGNTGAISRALALCGYGTQFGELDDDERTDSLSGDSMGGAGRSGHSNGGIGAPWNGPGACPSCRAPAGKKHASSCKL